MQESGPSEIGVDKQADAHSEGEVDSDSPAAVIKDQSYAAHRIPVPRDEHFAGREDILLKLRSGLESNGCVILSDPAADHGGYGKSAIAREYAYRRSDEYQVIWWLNASRASVLAGGYAALASELSLASEDSGRPAILRATRQWLSTHRDWLLIIDDVGAGIDLQPFLPEPIGGHVVLTSRNEPSNATCIAITIEPLSQDESMAILGDGLGGDDREVVRDLVMAFGENPVALDMIAAYVTASGHPLAEVAAHFEGPSNGDTLDSKAAVRAVLTASLKAVAEKDVIAQDLFAVCTFLGSDPFSIDRVRQGASAFPSELSEAAQDAERIETAVSLLCEYGLMRRCESGFSTDRRVKRAARDGMPRDLKKGCAGAALHLISAAFNPEEDDPDSVEERSTLLDHAYTVSMHTHGHKTAAKETDALLFNMGLHLKACDDPSSAMQCFVLSVELAASVHGPASPVFALRFNHLAMAQHSLGHLEEARSNFEKALDITETVVQGIRKTKLAPSCESILKAPSRYLSPLLVEMGESDAALDIYTRAMRILAEAYDRNHPLVGDCASRMANIWFSRGNWKRAQIYFAQAVQAEDNSLEGTDTRLSSHLINLGSTYLKLDQLDKARKQFERALDIDLAEHGPDHRSVGRDLDKLGQALSAQKNDREAEEAYRRALSIHEKAHPPNPEDLARTLKHLGRTLESQGSMGQAAPCFMRLIEVDEGLHGTDSVQVGKDLMALGRVLDEMDEYERARACYERTLEIETRCYGTDTERSATCIHRIGRTLESEEKLDGALLMYERAMRIDMKLNGNKHVSVARDAYAIGCLLAEKKDNIVAMGHLTMALEVYEESLGKSHSRTRKIREKIAELGS